MHRKLTNIDEINNFLKNLNDNENKISIWIN